MPAKAIATEASVRAAIAHLIDLGEQPSVRSIRWALAGCPVDRTKGKGSPNQILMILGRIRDGEEVRSPDQQIKPQQRPSPTRKYPDQRPPQTHLTFGSICSGIDAPALALGRLGWKPAWMSEIDQSACAVLRHRHHAIPIPSGAKARLTLATLPADTVPNLGDITRKDFIDIAKILTAKGRRLDLIVGGSPCVGFSSAGLRRGLRDPASRLSLRFIDIVEQLAPRVAIWENVDAVLTDKSNAFGHFLARLAGIDGVLTPTGFAPKKTSSAKPKHASWGRASAGYVITPSISIAWRVLDAEYFGSPQHRDRIFVVASRDPAIDPRCILFEEPTNGAEPPYDPDPILTQSVLDEIAIRYRTIPNEIADLRGTNITARAPFAVSQINVYRPGVGTMRASGGDVGGGSESILVPVTVRIDEPPSRKPDGSFEGGSYTTLRILPARRLSIHEAERSMGFEPGFTRVPGGTLGARFQQLGNSIALPTIEWISKRLTVQFTATAARSPPPSPAERDLGNGVRFAIVGDDVHAKPWPRSPIRTPIATTLDAEDCADESTVISPVAARGLLVRHLLRGRRIDPLFARGVLGAIAAILTRSDHPCHAELALAAAALAVIRSCFRDGKRTADRVIKNIFPGITSNDDMLAAIERKIGPYSFRDQVDGKPVRADHAPGIFDGDFADLDRQRLSALLLDPLAVPEPTRDAPASQRTAEAVASLWAAAKLPPASFLVSAAVPPQAIPALPEDSAARRPSPRVSRSDVHPNSTLSVLATLDQAIQDLQHSGSPELLRAAAVVTRAKAEVLELLAEHERH